MADLLTLAERCERATEADRYLDAIIDAALRIGKPDHPAWIRRNFSIWRGRTDGRCEVVHSDGRGGVNWASAKFTASIDAAVTLIPDGWFFSGLDQQSPSVRVWTEGNVAYYSPSLDGIHAMSPALALCAAALRARTFVVVGRGKET